jgi:biopolymer transport protein ExbD
MGMNVGGGGKRPISDINVTPLVDVMLVLLIIFIIATPAMKEDVSVDLPPGKGQPADAPTDDPLDIVTLDRNRIAHAGPYKVAFNDVEAEFLRLYRDQGKRVLRLRAHKELTHGDIVRVLSALRAAGVETILVEVDPREETAK